MDVLFREVGIYRFGPFRLDPVGRTLSRDGMELRLQARVFDTLLYLVEHHDHVVEREELMGAVWRGRTVDPNNLGQAISALRKALQVGADTTQWVATAQRGYRIAVPVTFEPFDPGPGALALSPAIEQPRRRWPWAMGVALALLSTALLALLLRHRPVEPTAPFAPPPRSLAVLAFANMTGNPGQDYLADGLAEELIDSLSRIKALQVVARSSAFVFKAHPAAIGDIARALNVSAVLEGSVRGDGGRLRIAAHLVDARTGFELWGQEYDRAPGDILAVETDIGTAVAKALRAALLPDDAVQMTLGGTNDAASFDHYLRGMTEEKSGAAGARAALAEFDAAIARDPHYARAYAQRAIVLSAMAGEDDGADPAVLAATQRNAVESARRAVDLAPALGVAHAALGRVLLECAMDFRSAAAAFARAEELAPGDAEVEFQATFMQGYLGHTDAAIAAALRTIALNPLSASAYRLLAQTYEESGEFSPALATLRHAEQLDTAKGPGNAEIHTQIDFLRRDYAKVLEDAAREGDWHEPFWDAIADHALGRTAEAASSLRKLQSIAGDTAAMQYADIYAQWGQRADATHWLHEAYRLHDPGLLEIRIDRLLDPIRSTQDYKEVEAALGMPP
ncbi:MAG TPA: winged helix-turn-helix domain-containing protein [Acetobacteraceae bacterium]|nr:winged helix-turn-helix domain-containing protein [Acetobacteraceae bacterium]